MAVAGNVRGVDLGSLTYRADREPIYKPSATPGDRGMKIQRIVYTQAMHSCGPPDDDASLVIEIDDAGGGEYLILHAEHWSFEGREDIDALHAKLVEMLETCVVEGPA